MKPLSPNGDIVKRQHVDPLTVSSREGIYEVARGIALRMAWNKPDAYEKANQGDWSFVGWDSTPFATQYNITWTKDSTESPLMFAAVRTLIDEWYQNFLKQSERYVGWRRYYSLTSSYYDRFGTYPIRSGEEAIGVDFYAVNVIGCRGSVYDPFLPGRARTEIDCGVGPISDAIRMVGASIAEGVKFDVDLVSVASPNLGGYLFSVGDASYKRFKKNSLTLDDEWEMGMAALIGMFDRCYWAMMSGGGELVHPPMVLTEGFIRGQARFSFESEAGEDERGVYVEFKPVFMGVDLEKGTQTIDYGWSDEIVLTRRLNAGGGSVAMESTQKYGEAQPSVERTGPGVMEAHNVYLNGWRYENVLWVKRSVQEEGSYDVRIEMPSVDCLWAKNLAVSERYEKEDEDHESESAWIFYRYDMDKDSGYHYGKCESLKRDSKLKPALDEWIKRTIVKDPFDILFENVDVTWGSFVPEKERFYFGNSRLNDIYNGNTGEYIGTVWDEPSIVDWGHYVLVNAREEITTKQEAGVIIPNEWRINGMLEDTEMRLKMAIIGRSDLPL